MKQQLQLQRRRRRRLVFGKGRQVEQLDEACLHPSEGEGEEQGQRTRPPSAKANPATAAAAENSQYKLQALQHKFPWASFLHMGVLVALQLWHEGGTPEAAACAAAPFCERLALLACVANAFGRGLP